MDHLSLHDTAGPYFVNCISESVEQNHFVVKVITMDEDWDGLIPQDRAGSQVQYSIAGQTRTVSWLCMCVVLDTTLKCRHWTPP